MKKILFVMRKPPHSGTYAQEFIDLILTVAAFDQDISLLLLDDGIFHLKTHQQPENYGLKDSLALFHSLPIYNIDKVYVESESLFERGLIATQLEGHILEMARNNLGQFFSQFDCVLSG